MKPSLLLALSLLASNVIMGQRVSTLEYQKELKRVQRLSDINVNINIHRACEKDSAFFIGWLILAKEASKATKASFISTDGGINASFKFHDNYPINVDWSIVEPLQDSVYIIRKFVVRCPASDTRTMKEFLTLDGQMEKEINYVWRAKVIALIPVQEQWQYPRR